MIKITSKVSNHNSQRKIAKFDTDWLTWHGEKARLKNWKPRLNFGNVAWKLLLQNLCAPMMSWCSDTKFQLVLDRLYKPWKSCELRIFVGVLHVQGCRKLSQLSDGTKIKKIYGRIFDQHILEDDILVMMYGRLKYDVRTAENQWIFTCHTSDNAK